MRHVFVVLLCLGVVASGYALWPSPLESDRGSARQLGERDHRDRAVADTSSDNSASAMPGPGSPPAADHAHEDVPSEETLAAEPDSATNSVLRIVIAEFARGQTTHVQLQLDGPDGQAWHTGAVVDGVFEVSPLAPGAYRVMLGSVPYMPIETEVELIDDEATELSYPVEFDEEFVTVEVRSEGRPVAGARVLRGVSLSLLFTDEVGHTDDAGTLPVLGLRHANVDIRVEADGHSPRWLKNASHRVVGSVLAVSLSNSSGVLARVTDIEGEPVPEVRVWIEATGLMDPFMLETSAITDAAGEVQFSDLAPTFYRAHFERDQKTLGTREFEAESGQQAEVEFVIRRSLRLTGSMSVNGRLVTRGVLTLSGPAGGQMISLASDGSFAADVLEGEYSVSFQSGGKGWTRVELGKRSIHGDDIWRLDYSGFDVTVVEARPAAVEFQEHSIQLVSARTQEVAAHAKVKDDSPVTFVGVPAGIYDLKVRYVKPLRAYAPPLLVNVDRNVEVRYEYGPVDEVTAVGLSVAPGSEAVRIEANALVPITLLGTDPLRLAWPVGSSGRGVITADKYAPIFFSVDSAGRLIPDPSFEQHPGGVIDPSGFEDEFTIYRVTPLDPGRGPASYWSQKSFNTFWDPARVRAGRYRVTLLDGAETIAEREVTVVAGESISVR